MLRKRLLAQAHHWRNRAAEVAAIAEAMTQEGLRRQLLEIAVEYDAMAQHAELSSAWPFPRAETKMKGRT